MDNVLSLTGKVLAVQMVQQIGNSKKAGLIMEITNGKYKEIVYFEAWKDKTELLAPLKDGQEVTVYFNVKSKEYKEKFYTSLNLWKIDVISDNTTANGQIIA